MIINELLSWCVDPDSFELTVEAVIENAIELPPSWYSPPEFEHAICKASMLLEDLGDWPPKLPEQLLFLEECRLDWKIVDNGEW